MTELFLDTETGPSLRDDVWTHLLKKHDGDKADAAKALEKTSLSGTFGELWVVSLAIDNDAPLTWTRNREDPDGERVMLEAVAQELRDLDTGITFSRNLDAIVAHNATFDRDMLRQRAIVHGIRLPPAIVTTAQPWDRANRWRCTMAMWTGDLRGRISLEDLALALAVDAPVKGADGVTGDRVWALICAGHLDRVAAYCADDVRRVRAIYRAITAVR